MSAPFITDAIRSLGFIPRDEVERRRAAEAAQAAALERLGIPVEPTSPFRRGAQGIANLATLGVVPTSGAFQTEGLPAELSEDQQQRLDRMSPLQQALARAQSPEDFSAVVNNPELFRDQEPLTKAGQIAADQERFDIAPEDLARERSVPLQAGQQVFMPTAGGEFTSVADNRGPIKLTPGMTAFDQNTNKEIARSPFKPIPVTTSQGARTDVFEPERPERFGQGPSVENEKLMVTRPGEIIVGQDGVPVFRNPQAMDAKFVETLGDVFEPEGRTAFLQDAAMREHAIANGANIPSRDWSLLKPKQFTEEQMKRMAAAETAKWSKAANLRDDFRQVAGPYRDFGDKAVTLFAGLGMSDTSLLDPDVSRAVRIVMDLEPGEEIPNSSAARDLAMIFAFMKLLDPPSVVRESEQELARSARGVAPLQVINRVFNGESLTDEQRADFMKTAMGITRAKFEPYFTAKEKYTDIAVRNGLDPDDVVVDIFQTLTDAVFPGRRADGTVDIQDPKQRFATQQDVDRLVGEADIDANDVDAVRGILGEAGFDGVDDDVRLPWE